MNSDCVLSRLQEEQREWVAYNFGSDRPSWHPLLGAIEELGELAHSHLKQEQGIRMNEDHEANARDAVADVVIYLSDYCTARGWDMAEIVDEVWSQVRLRDWKKNPDNANEMP